MKAPERVLRWPEVALRIGLSRTVVWRLERNGMFPSRRRLGANSVGWLQGEIEEWLRTRDAVRPQRGLPEPTGEGERGHHDG